MVNFQHSNRQSKLKQGLTLIEVMIAMAILGIGLSVLIQTAARCLSVISQSKSYETSRNLLNRVELEDPIALKEEVEEGTDSGTFDHPYSRYRWERNIEVVGEEEDGLFKVKTRVYWSERGDELYDEVVTYIYAPPEVEGGTVKSR